MSKLKNSTPFVGAGGRTGNRARRSCRPRRSPRSRHTRGAGPGTARTRGTGTCPRHTATCRTRPRHHTCRSHTDRHTTGASWMKVFMVSKLQLPDYSYKAAYSMCGWGLSLDSITLLI